jgi:hypothetical protein
VLRLLVTLAAVSLLLAGCGGGGSKSGYGNTTAATTTVIKPGGKPLTKAAYQAKLQALAKDISSKLQSSSSSSKGPSKADIAAAKTALNHFADELEQVNPPTEVKQAHLLLIQALRQFSNDVEGIFNNVSKAKSASDAIAAFLGAPAVQLLFKVQQQFKAKGYTLNLNGT